MSVSSGSEKWHSFPSAPWFFVVRKDNLDSVIVSFAHFSLLSVDVLQTYKWKGSAFHFFPLCPISLLSSYSPFWFPYDLKLSHCGTISAVFYFRFFVLRRLWWGGEKVFKDFLKDRGKKDLPLPWDGMLKKREEQGFWRDLCWNPENKSRVHYKAKLEMHWTTGVPTTKVVRQVTLLKFWLQRVSLWCWQHLQSIKKHVWYMTLWCQRVLSSIRLNIFDEGNKFSGTCSWKVQPPDIFLD